MSASDPSSFFVFNYAGYVGDNFKQFLLDHKNEIAQQICIRLEKSEKLKQILGLINCETINIDDIIAAINKIINNPTLKAQIIRIPIDPAMKSNLEPFKSTLINGKMLTEEQYNIILHLASLQTEAEKQMEFFMPELLPLAFGAAETPLLNSVLYAILIVLVIICILLFADSIGIISFTLPSYIISRQGMSNII